MLDYECYKHTLIIFTHLIFSTTKYIAQGYQNTYYIHKLPDFFAFRFTSFVVDLHYLSSFHKYFKNTYICNTIRLYQAASLPLIIYSTQTPKANIKYYTFWCTRGISSMTYVNQFSSLAKLWAAPAYLVMKVRHNYAFSFSLSAKNLNLSL